MINPEILSPVGDFECLKAAIQNGANAVYLGASSFSARAKATNFNNEELKKAICYAKLRNVKVHLALNTLIKNSEFTDAINLAITAYNLGVDAIIIQDIGLATYLLKNYPQIPLHASTQMTVHNLDGVKQLEKMGFSRVVLSRELSIDEIKYIRENTSIELEVFIHGALCISYSGQCLLSSTIGGRSGNRGLCAQPCRLPYELVEVSSNNQTLSLDKGYLLSPRDNLAIEFLPELIKSGINSFKIEGRMKTPTYVGTVTKIYRKYVDLVLKNISLDNTTLRKLILDNLNIKNTSTGLTDKEELTQVFNRGNFSTGHLNADPNRDLIYKYKPNNMGIYIGTITHINENKGHLKLKLEDTLSIGDKISINSDSYTVSELMIDNKNYESLEKGNIVKIGRMKGRFSVGTKIFRIESAKLNKFITPSFKEDKNFRKVFLNAKICVKSDSKISLKVWSDEGFYNGLSYTAISNVIPSTALNKPIDSSKIKEQLSKTGNTEFEFSNIDVCLDDNLFVQMSVLNDLRRSALEGLENEILKNHSHFINNLPSDFNCFEISSSSSNILNEKKISILLNDINLNYDYINLKNIDNLYIPLKFFLNSNYKNLLINLCNNFNTYIYMPFVLRNKQIEAIDFNLLSSKFNIKGFVVSHISQLEKLADLNLELIGNFNLNIYNTNSISALHDFNFSKFIASSELDKIEINNYNSCIPLEVIVYGKLPVMTNNYCYLGRSNKCYKDCDKKCLNNSKFYLKDRMNFDFRIIPDNSSTITTIYNSKILSINFDDINSNSVRIDILDENLNEIQNIIDTIKLGNRFEGKDYTNGSY